ncbi:serine/threonine-protein kinase [Phenylobacterium sp.]|uniref:serine/threonine-protein kinase n=1 Tax=Phenylobacterium sp. TaxID=1871053 RepID=UPI0025DBEABC|nr:serine/threonine-protein kinase [Phenylobacterium sp.]MBX3482204.1 protein kinase [Phenylobacterium sp.]
MDAAFERRVLEVFDEALGWDDPEALLARRHADEPALVAAVRRLLSAHARADDLPTAPAEPVSPFEIQPPERVGAYRLAEELGRGGMGLVYRGERIEGGFEQTVAIKLMRGGLFSASAAEQFALERRILARLRHPHITQLFDGGVTPEGLSYIVMERVEGLSITDHVATAGAPLKARLRLFLELCAGVGHAHANGVIHADLKPSNVVVDRGVGVKVLDFGIAALIDAANRETERASRPRAHTARYASPQQAAGEPAHAGDDVYALGVLLEELAAPTGMDAELAAVAAKARAPALADRYPDVRHLAADVERWLIRQPVGARPPSLRRNALFFARRHPLAIASATAAAAGLVLALAVTTSLYLRAEQRLAQVRGLSVYLLDDVTRALLRAPGTAQLRHDVADRGRAYLEALDRPGARPDIRMEVAQGYSRMGEALTQVGGHAVGDVRTGKQDLARAEAELRRLMAAGHAGPDTELELVRTLNARAHVLQNIDNDAGGASAVYAESCRRAEDLLRRRPDDPRVHFARLDCLGGRANLMNYEGQFDRMPPLLAQMIAGYRALPPTADPEDAALGLAKTYNLLGDATYFARRPRDALPIYRQAAEVLEQARARGRDVRILDQLAFTQFNLSSTLQEMGRHADELAAAQRGVEVSALLGAFEDSPRARHVDNIVRMQHAVALSDNGRHAEAIAEATAGVEARRRAAAARPDDYNSARAVPVGMKPLGEIYLAAGKRREACAAYQAAVAAWRDLRKRTPLNDFDGGPELKEVEAKARATCGTMARLGAGS